MGLENFKVMAAELEMQTEALTLEVFRPRRGLLKSPRNPTTTN
jgi:hypothetical protein